MHLALSSACGNMFDLGAGSVYNVAARPLTESEGG